METLKSPETRTYKFILFYESIQYLCLRFGCATGSGHAMISSPLINNSFDNRMMHDARNLVNCTLEPSYMSRAMLVNFILIWSDFWTMVPHARTYGPLRPNRSGLCSVL